MDYIRMLYFEETHHSLLNPQPRAYSSSTVRRAFIVWLHCGQRNSFREVCNYYHQLEAMENKLPLDVRKSSRNHEEELFTHLPPTSPYLKENFPHLYSTDYLKTWETLRNEALANHNITKEITNDSMSKSNNLYLEKIENMKKGSSFLNAQSVDNVFMKNHENLNKGSVKIIDVTEIENKIEKNDKPMKDMKMQSGFLNEISGKTRHDIVVVSQMIRNHCKNHLIPLNKFLNEFKEFGERSELKNTVYNVNFYIKRKMIHAELKMIADQKNNLKTFEDELDLISFEGSAKKQQEITEKVEDLDKNEKILDNPIEKKILNKSIEAIEDTENWKIDMQTLTPLRAIMKTDGVIEEFKTEDPGSVIILSSDDGTPKSNSEFSNSFVTMEIMKVRKI